MSNTPRNLPRFLPTLTEVVPPPGWAATSAAATTPDLEEVVQSVLQRVNVTLDRRVREEADTLVRNLVTEQLQTLNQRLRQELEVVVRQAVADAMTAPPDFHK